MLLKDILLGGGGILIIIMSILQVSKIEINPWSFIGRIIGRMINGEIIEKVDQLSEDFTDLKNSYHETLATAARTRILNFGDDILHGISHSKGHFDQILSDIKLYEDYCDEHPHYKNNIAAAVIKRIEEKYDECLRDGTFLQ